MPKNEATAPSFLDFSLSEPVLKALNDAGYETPTPIQSEIIPYMMEGRDVLGQAQTGTGKTAAFALPLLSRIDIKNAKPQVLVLAPTRELAIQVAEAFQKYASRIKNFHVIPVYGGQDYGIQIRQLQRGVHVVVGTPGRLMDHMRRGTLNLDALDCLVLDEADEMLRMGFIDDVEWILEKTPKGRQIALFSATLPETIRRIAKKHLNNQKEITIKAATTTAENINQRYWMVSEPHKIDALTRILEAEPIDGAIIFVRTKTQTVELAEKLQARGYACSALNGDIAQKQRERTIDNIKKGKLDILVATDVAARGLDVERVSHVFNYDIPYDTEAYIHRVGRTGRAGRSGEAILFVAPRERRMLRAIEQATKQQIKLMELPSTETINNQRIVRFMDRISDTLSVNELGFFYQLVERYRQEHNVPAIEIAAALAKMVQGDEPMLLPDEPKRPKPTWEDRPNGRKESSRRGRAASKSDLGKMESGMERYRIEVGLNDGVKHNNIVGAIANEGNLDSSYIGRINIFDDFSTVDLPEGMPREILHTLKRTWVSGKRLKISKMTETPQREAPKKKGKYIPKGKKKDGHRGKGFKKKESRG